MSLYYNFCLWTVGIHLLFFIWFIPLNIWICVVFNRLLFFFFNLLLLSLIFLDYWSPFSVNFFITFKNFWFISSSLAQHLLTPLRHKTSWPVTLILCDQKIENKLRTDIPLWFISFYKMNNYKRMTEKLRNI